MLTLTDITAISRPLTMDEACAAVLNHCPNPYARAYAEAWIDRSVHSFCRAQGIPVEASVQAAYILSNLAHWRGPMATRVRTDLKAIASPKGTTNPDLA
jgi:hypothetical protein